MNIKVRALFLPSTKEKTGFLTTRCIITVIACIAITTLYINDVSRPDFSNDGFLGWVGWYDQGEYYKSANALASGNLAPSEHTYPPGYPILAAPFIRLSPQHAFLPVILVSSFLVFFIFLSVATRALGLAPATLSLILGAFALPDVTRAYVIPWTNTFSAALLGLLYFLIDRVSRKVRYPTGRGSLLHTLAIAFVAGYIFTVRPVDILLTIPAAIALLAIWYRSWSISTCRATRPYIIMLALGLPTAALAPSLMLLFNQVVYADAFGGYLKIATPEGGGGGFDFAIVLQKMISLLIDGREMYLTDRLGLFSLLPWTLMGICALPCLFFRLPIALKALSIACLMQLFVYSGFGDLTGHNLYKYLNVRCFIWPTLWLSFFATWGILLIIKQSGRHRVATSLIIISGSIILLCLRVNATRWPAPDFEIGPDNRAQTFRVTHNKEQPISFIDLLESTAMRFHPDSRQTKVWVDGVPLLSEADYKVCGGTALPFFRILFTRPISGEVIDVNLTPTSPTHNISGASRIYLGTLSSEISNPVYKRGGSELSKYILLTAHSTEQFEFGHDRIGNYLLREGWSSPEQSHAWSNMAHSVIEFGVIKDNHTHELTLTGNTFGKQNTDIIINGTKVGSITGVHDQQIFKININVPPDRVTNNGKIRLELRHHNAVSPFDLGMNGDKRQLAIALKGLKVSVVR
ncbi:hypothetical protein [Synoicihabitans lomoniglobus]|uniref:Uncharacterized protein n=1 Tax=Synoicihabitans lomoniglobus TaxID=2909285 RepID=A0AAF0CSN5_9BACT|nr:hypothetical protein [Opitutaceae bacterium LMO-M01]WED67374.1 hypothetical protein PXH66_10990 [Opitutaceae bacterium LMO-M01]